MQVKFGKMKLKTHNTDYKIFCRDLRNEVTDDVKSKQILDLSYWISKILIFLLNKNHYRQMNLKNKRIWIFIYNRSK